MRSLRPANSRRARASAADHGRAAATLDDDVVERLVALLDGAANLDLRDRVGWARLRDAARVTIGGLVAGGRLPHHLGVAPDDPPVLVTRTIAAAWRHASAPPRHLDRPRAAS